MFQYQAGTSIMLRVVSMYFLINKIIKLAESHLVHLYLNYLVPSILSLEWDKHIALGEWGIYLGCKYKVVSRLIYICTHIVQSTKLDIY